MIKTIEDLYVQYKEYQDIMGKIRRTVDKNELFPIIRGLYETEKKTPGHYLAAYIYGPSYLSFEYALYHYHLIPENVYTYTSATVNKQKSKKYQTLFGTFTYQDVPVSAYPLSVIAKEENGYVYFIATKEKALCDTLYKMKPVGSIKQLKMALFEDLRINEDEFKQLDVNLILNLTRRYKSTNLSLLETYVKEVLSCKS